MPAQYTDGQVLPNGATVANDTFLSLADGTTVESLDEVFPSGATNHTIITTPGANTPAANQAALQQRAQAALTNNVTYLAIPSPTNAQAVTQVSALTRQVDGIIRLLLNQFDTITGT